MYIEQIHIQNEATLESAYLLVKILPFFPVAAGRQVVLQCKNWGWHDYPATWLAQTVMLRLNLRSGEGGTRRRRLGKFRGVGVANIWYCHECENTVSTCRTNFSFSACLRENHHRRLDHLSTILRREKHRDHHRDHRRRARTSRLERQVVHSSPVSWSSRSSPS